MDFNQIKFNLGLLYSFLIWKTLGATPRMANFDITSRCNQRCQHCYFFRNLTERERVNK